MLHCVSIKFKIKGILFCILLLTQSSSFLSAFENHKDSLNSVFILAVVSAEVFFVHLFTHAFIQQVLMEGLLWGNSIAFAYEISVNKTDKITYVIGDYI